MIRADATIFAVRQTGLSGGGIYSFARFNTAPRIDSSRENYLFPFVYYNVVLFHRTIISCIEMYKETFFLSANLKWHTREVNVLSSC